MCIRDSVSLFALHSFPRGHLRPQHITDPANVFVRAPWTGTIMDRQNPHQPSRAENSSGGASRMPEAPPTDRFSHYPGDEVTRAGNRHGIPVSGWQPSTTRLARRSTGCGAKTHPCVTSPPHVAWLLPEAVQRADSHGVLVVRSHQGRDEVVGVLVLVELAHRRVDL